MDSNKSFFFFSGIGGRSEWRGGWRQRRRFSVERRVGERRRRRERQETEGRKKWRFPAGAEIDFLIKDNSPKKWRKRFFQIIYKFSFHFFPYYVGFSRNLKWRKKIGQLSIVTRVVRLFYVIIFANKKTLMLVVVNQFRWGKETMMNEDPQRRKHSKCSRWKWRS